MQLELEKSSSLVTTGAFPRLPVWRGRDEATDLLLLCAVRGGMVAWRFVDYFPHRVICVAT